MFPRNFLIFFEFSEMRTAYCDTRYIELMLLSTFIAVRVYKSGYHVIQ